MPLLPKTLRQALRMPPPAVVSTADALPALNQPPVLQAPPLADALAVRGCGWFDSSFELRRGLAVRECDAAEWFGGTVATLDQVRLEPSSARLQ